MSGLGTAQVLTHPTSGRWAQRGQSWPTVTSGLKRGPWRVPDQPSLVTGEESETLRGTVLPKDSRSGLTSTDILTFATQYSMLGHFINLLIYKALTMSQCFKYINLSNLTTPPEGFIIIIIISFYT